MNKLTKFFATAAAVSLVASPIAAHADAWYPVINWHPANYGAVLSELSGSYITNFQTYKGEAQYLCDELGSAPCTWDKNITAFMVGPVCDKKSVNCLDEVFAIVDGEKVTGQFIRYLAPDTSKAIASRKLFGEGGSTSLWTIPGALNAGGTDTYAVTLSYTLEYFGDEFYFKSFSTSIEPYAEKAYEGAEQHRLWQGKVNGIPMVEGNGAPAGCAWAQDKLCGVLENFADNQQVGLRLRLQNDITGWFKGRLSSPDISITKFNALANTIEVSAAPVKSAVLNYQDQKANATSAMKKLYASGNMDLGVFGTRSDSDWAMKVVEGFRSVTQDTAAGESTYWTFGNISVWSGPRCLVGTNKVAGIVTTNAMAYQGEPPVYKDGFLNYKVAGLHYQADGVTPVLGSYDLVMRKSVASCLYGLSSAPVSGAISVVNEKGVKTFATTTVGEKDGWIKLSAKGFTFSKKTIKVKITKKKK